MASANTEMGIERKFLLNNLFQQVILSYRLLSRPLTQYYVQVGDVEERYRQQDNLYFHAIKNELMEVFKGKK